MEQISYKTFKSWLEEITTSKYKWRSIPGDEPRFDDLEGLVSIQEGNSPHFEPVVRTLPVSSYAPRPFLTEQVPFWRRPVAIAAVVSLLMIALYHFILPIGDNQVRMVAGVGEQQEFVLPDGSNVILNAGSSLTYDEVSFNAEREVNLEGEAWFDVKKGSDFEVKTGPGTVQVLGTSFNVFARPTGFKVGCAEGSVRVAVGQEAVVLKPGDQVILDPADGLLLASKNEIENIGTWKSGIFLFDDEPVSHVFAELERQFGVKVQREGFADLRYSGLFKGDDLQTSLDLVCKPLGLTYQIRQIKGQQTILIE